MNEKTGGLRSRLQDLCGVFLVVFGLVISLAIGLVVGVAVSYLCGAFADRWAPRLQQQSAPQTPDSSAPADFSLPNLANFVPTSKSDPLTIQSLNYGLTQYERRQREEVEIARNCSPPLPRHYVAYKLRGGQSISIDGRLDDPAWAEVPWTEDFVDIMGYEFPTGNVTRAKLRYDSSYLYVAALLKDSQVKANQTLHDSQVIRDNAFVFLVDVDGSTHKYKEVAINVLGTTVDFMLERAFVQWGEGLEWEGIEEHGVFTDGVPNNASVPASFWSLELKLPFSALNQNTTRTRLEPDLQEMWLIEMGRVYCTPAATFQKVPDSCWWEIWQPTGDATFQLANRWGLLFFSQSAPSLTPSVPHHPRWRAYRALFHIFEAEMAYRATTYYYTYLPHKLNLPLYIYAGCLQSLDLEVDFVSGTFNATVVTPEVPFLQAHINEQRYVWFTEL